MTWSLFSRYKSELGFVVLNILLFSMINVINTSAHGGGEEESLTEYPGPILIVPYIEDSVLIDGLFAQNEYPEVGYLNLAGFENIIRLSHNDTNFFVGMIVESNQTIGFGFRAGIGHGDSINNNYFVINSAKIGGNNVVSIWQLNDDFGDPVLIQPGSVSVNVNIKDGDQWYYEFSITILVNKRIVDHNSFEGSLPASGELSRLMFFKGSPDDINTQIGLVSEVVPSYFLRQNEDASEMSELFSNPPSFLDAFAFPIVLVIITGLTVRYYNTQLRSNEKENE